MQYKHTRFDVKNDIIKISLNLYVCDVYDYRKLKVLINVKEDSELFSKNDNSGSMYSNQNKGETIQI